ncbi:MAG: hypothetical protein RLZZ618_850, partial [Pseudomonadota bacterium]
MNYSLSAPAPSPSLTLLGIEPLRAAFEYASMRFMDHDALPSGDGHPVVIFPGLASDQRALVPLRDCCERLGYTVYDWEHGFNTGPQGDVDDWLADLSSHVQSVAAAHEARVSLVGWSLGGIYARELAKELPDLVRCVVTLGTPFAGPHTSTNAWRIYQFASGRSIERETENYNLPEAPPVPTTSIYSRSDGVVAWRGSL